MERIPLASLKNLPPYIQSLFTAPLVFSPLFLGLAVVAGLPWTWAMGLWIALNGVLPMAILACERIESAPCQTGVGTLVMTLTLVAPAQLASMVALERLFGNLVIPLAAVLVPLIPFATKLPALKELLADLPTDQDRWHNHPTLKYVDLDRSCWIYQKYSKHSLPRFDRLQVEGHPIMILIFVGVLVVAALGVGVDDASDTMDSGLTTVLWGIGFMAGPAMTAVFGGAMFQGAALALYLRAAEKLLGRPLVTANPQGDPED